MPNEAKSRKAFEERVSKHGGYLTPQRSAKEKPQQKKVLKKGHQIVG